MPTHPAPTPPNLPRPALNERFNADLAPLPTLSHHHRPGLESVSDRVTLTDYEARRLLNAIVKEFVQMTAEELEQQAAEGNRYTS